MTWMPWAILSGLVLEAISAWIERHAMHIGAYEVTPPFRVFQYGTVADNDQPGVRHWVFALKLPSYQWAPIDYGRRQGWAQLHLVWVDSEGWRFEHWPV